VTSVKKHTLLVIAPYTKHMGLAVFRDHELVYFAVKTFTRPRTPVSIYQATTKHVKAVLKRFGTAKIALDSLDRNSSVITTRRIAIEAAGKVAEQLLVPVISLSFASVKNRLSTTKAEVFATMLRHYPELARYANNQNRSQLEYSTPLLTAVALGHFYARHDH
jgi:hypothetical protein